MWKIRYYLCFMSETIALVKTNSLHWVASGIGGVSKRFVRVLEARHIVCKVKDAHYFRNLVCYRLDYVSVSGSLKSSANFKTMICVIVLQWFLSWNCQTVYDKGCLQRSFNIPLVQNLNKCVGDMEWNSLAIAKTVPRNSTLASFSCSLVAIVLAKRRA